jgi:hypothetical protein
MIDIIDLAFIHQEKLGALAVPLMKKSLEVQPAYLPAHFDIAVSYVMANQYDEAEVAAQQIALLSPGHGAIRYIMEEVSKHRNPQPPFKNGPNDRNRQRGEPTSDTEKHPQQRRRNSPKLSG